MPNSAKSTTPPLAVLYTVGHSTHPIERFLELLGEHSIAILADIRSFPGSRRWPQFNQEQLAQALGRGGIEYRWLKRLGGRRHGKRADSPHVAWTVAAFRSYADYTESDEFAQGPRRTDGSRRPRAHGNHVFGGTVVAMPSANRLRPDDGWRMGGPTHNA